VLAVAAAVSLPHWFEPVRWSDPDALYYQAKMLKFRGQDERTALHRAFSSSIARQLHRAEESKAASRRQFTSSRWIDYSSRFFRRRPVVPLIAAGVYPAFGDRSLLTVSMVGYLLLALALYALLRRRFSSTTSVVVTIACLLAPPLRTFSFVPMTDSWGLLLETCALLAAVLTFDRGMRWLAVWAAVIVALSVTRDDTIVPLVAVLCLVIHQRDRRSALLAATGVAAALPAPLIFGNASVRENFAYVFSGYNPPKDDSWSFVLSEFWPHLRHLIRADLTWGVTDLGLLAPIWYLGLALAAVGVVLLIRSARAGDPFFLLHCYSLIGAAILVALFGDYSGLRQELVFIPPLAVGLALLVDRALKSEGVRRRARQLVPAAARGPSPGRSWGTCSSA
jgi:hypothetical protein